MAWAGHARQHRAHGRGGRGGGRCTFSARPLGLPHGLALQVLPLDSCRVRGVRFPCPGSARSLLRRYYGEDCLETVKKDLHVANMESKERAGGFDAVRGMDAAGKQ